MGDTETCETRYLSSKKTVDDRALNQGVMARLRAEVAARGPQPLRVLEIGAGIGTMVARLADWQVVTRAHYRLLDVDPKLLREARSWLLAWATGRGLAAAAEGEGLRLEGQGLALSVAFETAESGDLLFGGGQASAAPAPEVDLLIANAFLDLVEVPVVLPPLFRLVVPGGLGFFSTINFDGETIFLPEHPADQAFMQAYHRSMDERVRFGRPAGESKAGRRLFGHLRAAGASILAAGSSDWVVYGQGPSYEADEGFFLHTILDTVAEALAQRREIEPGPLAEWVALRRQQVDRGELTFLAHQLDFLVRCPSTGGKGDNP